MIIVMLRLHALFVLTKISTTKGEYINILSCKCFNTVWALFRAARIIEQRDNYLTSMMKNNEENRPVIHWVNQLCISIQVKMSTGMLSMKIYDNIVILIIVHFRRLS